MQINLAKRGPSMWFLGQPKNIIVSLNTANPGPIDIDFDNLIEEDQKRILSSLQHQIIESDVDFQTLYRKWAKSKPAVVEKPVEDPRIKGILEANQRLAARRVAMQTSRDRIVKRRQDRCVNLTGKSIRAIKASLTGEEDILLIKMILQAEQVGKNRKGVIQFIEEKMTRLSIKAHKKISKNVNKLTKAQLKRNPGKETIALDVVESEQTTVVLTAEDLITAATQSV